MANELWSSPRWSDGSWEPMGADKQFVVGRIPRSQRRLSWISICLQPLILFMVGAGWLLSPPPEGLPRIDSVWLVAAWLTWAFVDSVFVVVAIRRVRSRVEVDPFGVTVRNTWRTHRFRWCDVDAVVLQGHPGVTVLARDRVARCDSFPAPRSRGRFRYGPSERHRVEAAADYLEALRRFYSNARAEHAC